MPGGPRESKTSPRRLRTAERRAQALKLRAAGMKYPDIAAQLGYASRGAAAQDVQRALLENVGEPAAELRALEVERLDMLWQTAMRVLAGKHPTVSNGRVVMIDGTPVPDVGPVLAAIDRLLKIQERRARLLGLDSPTKVELIDDSTVDAEIRRLTEELDRVEAAQAADTAGVEAAEG